LIHALLLCGKARMRSPTAADIVADWPGIASDFAGLSADAAEKLSREHILWADVIFVMERRQARRLNLLHGPHLRGKRVVTLNIPDRFAYGDPDLVALLAPRLRAVLRPGGPAPLASAPPSG
jgi:predicted protein tyrosine phosphatase